MNKKHLIILGIGLNAMCACVFIAWPIKYNREWDTFKKTNLENWTATDEKLLHLLNYELLPFAALIMLISILILWKLRK